MTIIDRDGRWHTAPKPSHWIVRCEYLIAALAAVAIAGAVWHWL